ncbi:MAG: hypothetical protein B7X47_00360 [Ferrovum sp. 34-44-207]|nr:MAG: hypothetical protein B7X47_00360 [Ferrovum sp. 34-44-207]
MKFTDLTKQIKKIDIATDMTLFNPSLISENDELKVMLRVIEEDKNKKNRKGFFYSENWIVNYDDQFNFKNYSIIDDEGIINQYRECSYGLEDGRLFKWNNENWVIFSGLNIENKKFINTMCIAKLVGNKLKEFTFIPSPQNKEREKNWVPLVKDNELYIIYNIDPLEIYLYKNGTLSLFYKSKKKYQRFFISGSSTAIQFNNNYIFVSHHREKMNVIKKLFLKLTNKERYKKEKIYFYHQFHLLDESLRRLRTSKKFNFEKKGIEFCAGIAIKHDNIFMSYGLSDQAAYLIKLSISDIFSDLSTMELKSI